MLTSSIDWFLRDPRTGRIVIAQWPNRSLWIYIVASIVGLVTDGAGPIGFGTRLVATASLLFWAGDELTRGVNPWRRSLGAAVLIALATRLVAWLWR